VGYVVYVGSQIANTDLDGRSSTDVNLDREFTTLIPEEYDTNLNVLHFVL
jgi:hypothetical protein